MPILDHQAMLRDARRLDAYRRAICAALRPGDVVCDLGAGSGILGFFALSAGAGRVYAIEQGEEIHQAAAIARDNGFSDRYTPLRAHSREAVLPERVDLLIVEWLSSLGANEQPLSDLADACARFLKPDGRLIPHRVRHLVAPLEDAPAWHTCVGMFGKDFHGFDFGHVASLAACAPHIHRNDPAGLLSAPACWLTVTLADPASHPPAERYVGEEVVCTVERDGICHGLAAWFEADLGFGVSLDNAPASPETFWKNLYLPFEQPLALKAGDRLAIRLGVRGLGRRADLFWECSWMREGRRLGSAGSPGFYARSLSPEELARMTGNFVPLPDTEDACLCALLEQVDGQRDAFAVAQGACAAHPECFASPEDALETLIRHWRSRPVRL